jgi:predicted nucleotide-binding protein
MIFKHSGSLDDLESLIRACGFNVREVSEIPHGHRVATVEGAIVNWYVTTGKVSIQGKEEARVRLSSEWQAHTGDSKTGSVSLPVNPEDPKFANKRVFVVHGHDVDSRDQLELILRRLDLEPFILANTSGGGLTIIEALEKEIGPRPNQARFGIVLLTPDDMGYAIKDGPDKAEPRARQNVVLEMGMLIAALGRPNVAILKKGHLEVPSDAHGILYMPFNNHVRETVHKLTDRLRSAGFALTPEAISRASS